MNKLLLLIALLFCGSIAYADPVPSVTAEYAFATTESLGTAVTDNIASSGNVFHIACYNANAAARFFQIYDGLNTDDATKLKLSILVPATNMIMVGPNELGANGAYFANGITWGFSTAVNSFTAGSAADCTVFIKYNKRN